MENSMDHIATTRKKASLVLHSWEFTFTDKSSGRMVTSGVFAPEFTSARNKARLQLAHASGVDGARYEYASHKRLC